MARKRGYTVAATAVCAMINVKADVRTKHPRRIMLVRSPTIVSMPYARRRVRPVLVKTMPMASDPKMNQTDGSRKSVKTVRGARIMNSTWMTATMMLVTPIGITSNTHQVAVRRNSPSAAFPSRVSGKDSPLGSTASPQAGEM